jgi:hypothetical protein
MTILIIHHNILKARCEKKYRCKTDHPRLPTSTQRGRRERKEEHRLPLK